MSAWPELDCWTVTVYLFKNKDGVNDLKKAQWYINHLIAHVENDAEKLKTMEEILIDKQLDELHDEDWFKKTSSL